MKRFPILFLLCVLVSPAIVRADLPGDVRAVLSDKLFAKDQISIDIVQLGGTPAESRTVYEHKATLPRIPASNLKLITTAAALDKFGRDFQFKTMLAMRGQDVAIIGDGDPTLGDAEMLRKLGWGVDTVFKSWAELLKSRGITQVGNVVVDDSIFDQTFMHPSWPSEQEHRRYVAQVGGVNLNANCIDFYLRTTSFGQTVEFRSEPPTAFAAIRNTCLTGSKNAIWLSRQLGTNDIVLRGETNVSNDEPVSVTIHDPSMFAATVLAETLQANGITMTGQVIRDRSVRAAIASAAPATQPSERWVPIAVHATPIGPVLNRTNKDSMNLYAEALCKRLGAATTQQSGSWENGTAAIGEYLRGLGVESESFSLDDGCGLSKKNTISADAIVKVLQREFHGPDRELYMSSLAVGGIDGTLKDRFSGSSLRGRVFGKSGYVLGVRSLSGYLHARNGQWYAFSILMNGLPEGADWNAKPLQEKIIQAIDDASGSPVAAGQ